MLLYYMSRDRIHYRMRNQIHKEGHRRGQFHFKSPRIQDVHAHILGISSFPLSKLPGTIDKI